MKLAKADAVAGPIQTLFNLGAVADWTDGQLLERFATDRGEVAELAFSALVERHGPMVFRACRAILGDPDDARDASQATFLVLIRKARTLWVRDSIGPWLHQVACRTSRCARSASARRRRLERHAAVPVDGARDEPVDDLGRLLHEEIDRLPDRFRQPLIVCDLEGRTTEQAARHLGWPVGTVKSRLSRGRARLRERLARRGLAPDAVLIAAGSSGPSAGFVFPTIAAGVLARGAAATIAQGVIRSMLIAHWGKVASALLVAALATSGVALIAQDGPIDAGAEGKAQVAPGQGGPSVAVKPGKLRSTVVGRATVEPARAFDVVNQVEGSTTIIRIQPEGQRVKEGEVVAELDSAELRDRLTNRRVSIQQAESSYKQALLTREVAEFALKEYVEGVSRRELDLQAREIEATEAAIRKAEARMQRARKALDRLKISRDRRALLETSGDILADLDIEDRIEAAELAGARERLALDRAKEGTQALKSRQAKEVRSLNTEIAKARADEEAQRRIWEQEKSKGAKLESQIGACVLKAPGDGVVVYANDPNPAGPRLNIEEGATVRERQKILRVMDFTGPLRAIVKVPESMVDQVQRGDRARIKLGPFAEETATGVVESVAPMADPGWPTDDGIKYYTTRVLLDAPAGLRPGQAVQAEILLDERDGVLAVPVASVVSFEDQYQVAVVKPDGGIDWRTVRLGLRADPLVEVKGGLMEGEIVATDPIDRMTPEERRTKRRADGRPKRAR